jgi:hypothetical protein
MTAMPEGKIVCIGGDGGELNSLKAMTRVELLTKMLEHIISMGEIAKQMREGLG